MSFPNGITAIFLGFLTGVIWLVLASLGYVTDLFVLLGLGGVLGKILNILIALVGFLGFLFFGLLVFKHAWRSSK